jgi:molybdopterin converting factor subunit 1
MKLNLKIRLFGSVKDEVGTEIYEIKAPEGSTVRDLENLLRRELPGLWSGRSQLFIAVNQNYSKPDDMVSETDEIALFPMVNGG